MKLTQDQIRLLAFVAAVILVLIVGSVYFAFSGAPPPRIAVEIAVEGRVVRTLTVEEVSAALTKASFGQYELPAMRVDLTRAEACGK